MKKVKLIAVLAALAAAVCLYYVLNQASQPQKIPTAQVVSAAADIPENTVVTAEMLQTISVPAAAALPGVVTDASAAVGKITNSEVLAGEQLLSRRLTDAVGDQSGGSLSYAISKGMRAMTIAVTDTSGLAGMLKPGNRVDVVLLYVVTGEKTSLDPSGQTQTEQTAKNTSRLLMQDVGVLAVNAVMDKAGSADPYATVTLELTPRQALDLTLAAGVGGISLILRSPLDTDASDAAPVTEDALQLP